jgi:hypothetical protein
MKNNVLAQTVKPFFLVVICLVCITGSVSVVNAGVPVGTDTSGYSEKSGAFKFEASLDFGFGFKTILIGKTDKSDVTISGGGGIAGSLGILYDIGSSFEIGLSAGYQHSFLSETVENADGSFGRFIARSNINYGIRARSNGILKIGGGLGYYIPGNLDIDASKVQGGAHVINSYDPALGFHVTGQYVILSDFLSYGFGLTYTNVSYELTSYTKDGVKTPINALDQVSKNEFMKLDGSSIDLTMKLILAL